MNLVPPASMAPSMVPYTLPPMAAATVDCAAAMESAAFMADRPAEFVSAVLKPLVTAAPAEAEGRVRIRRGCVIVIGHIVRIHVRVRVIRISRVGVDRRADSDSESHRSLSRCAGQDQHHHQRHHRKGYLL